MNSASTGTTVKGKTGAIFPAHHLNFTLLLRALYNWVLGGHDSIQSWTQSFMERLTYSCTTSPGPNPNPTFNKLKGAKQIPGLE